VTCRTGISLEAAARLEAPVSYKVNYNGLAPPDVLYRRTLFACPIETCMRAIRSIIDLAAQVEHPRFDMLRKFYSIASLPAVRLNMNEPAWQQASAVFGVPRADLENQNIVSVRDLHLGTDALFNPLRASRVKPPSGLPAADLIDDERIREGCGWCEGGHGTDFVDAFGAVRSPDGRIEARGNWARGCAISGVVYGDREMHNLLRLSKEEFVGLFTVAEEYIRQSRTLLPSAHFFLCFLNGGPKSAAGVPHCHLQVLGRTDRHFAYAETIRARCPEHYWQSVEAVHRDIGLRLGDAESTAWVNIVPVKERDMVVAAPSFKSGASLIFDMLQVLYAHGTNNFTLAAIVSPSYVRGGGANGFHDWPAILWRFVDRGDMRARHSDIGGAELFGSSIIATDPWQLAGTMVRWAR
jgi:hypothetical protein